MQQKFLILVTATILGNGRNCLNTFWPSEDYHKYDSVVSEEDCLNSLHLTDGDWCQVKTKAHMNLWVRWAKIVIYLLMGDGDDTGVEWIEP
jgi:hypothetical protein